MSWQPLSLMLVSALRDVILCNSDNTCYAAEHGAVGTFQIWIVTCAVSQFLILRKASNRKLSSMACSEPFKQRAVLSRQGVNVVVRKAVEKMDIHLPPCFSLKHRRASMLHTLRATHM